MKLPLVLLGAASAALAAVDKPSIHIVTVGADHMLVYNPSTIFASAGDIIQFQFYPQNHTVTQSSPTTPCVPLVGGFFSGFIATSNTTAATTFVLTVNGSSPLYFYSSQGTECKSGMVGVVNPNNSTSQTGYATLAANSTSNSSAPAGGPAGGVLETVATLTNNITTTIVSTATPTPVPSSTSMASSTGTSSVGVSAGGPTTTGGTGTATGSAAASTSSGAAVGIRTERWVWGVVGVMGWQWGMEWGVW